MKLNSQFHFSGWSLGYRQNTELNWSWCGNLEHILELMEVELLCLVLSSRWIAMTQFKDQPMITGLSL